MAGRGGGAPGPYGRGTFIVTVDGEPLSEILENRETLVRAAEDYLSLAEQELSRLRRLNVILADQVALLRSQVAAQSAEIAYLRSQGLAAPGGSRRRPF